MLIIWELGKNIKYLIMVYVACEPLPLKNSILLTYFYTNKPMKKMPFLLNGIVYREIPKYGLGWELRCRLAGGCNLLDSSGCSNLLFPN